MTPDRTLMPAPSTIARGTLTLTRGVTAGWIAGVPQVALAQAAGLALGVRERADIGPRFIRRATQHTGRSLTTPVEWLLAGVFHFEYAAWWGGAYAVLIELIGHRRVPPWLGGAGLAAIVYTAAFSPLGGAAQTGAERPLGRRSWHETALHCTAAGSFGFATAYAYRWLRSIF